MIMRMLVISFLAVVVLTGCSLKKAEPVSVPIEPETLIEGVISDEVRTNEPQPVGSFESWSDDTVGDALDSLHASVEAADLVGGWLVRGADYEEILLELGGDYGTFLSQRPYDNGIWILNEANELMLDSSVDGFDTVLRIMSRDRENIYFVDHDDNEIVWSTIE